MPRTSLVHALVLPALIGLCAGLAILLWAPQWIAYTSPSAASTETSSVSMPATPVFSYASAVDVAAPAVVNIYTRKVIQRKLHPLYDDPLFQRFFNTNPEPNERIQSSLGSGVIMTQDGYILTNNHVVNNADQIVIALRDGRESSAMLVGSDPEADLAVLKVDLDDLPPMPTADPDTLRIGDVALAIGNPLGVGQTVTMGIVSATGRNQLGINIYEDYIQTDAAINPGNSGGALINARGELMGINTAIFSQGGGSEGIGFAIPVDVAMRTLKDIAEHGATIRGWLGIEVQEANPKLLNALGLPQALTGLIVTGIYEDGPADTAGLSVGDIIVDINGMDASNARRAMNQIAALRPGDNIDIGFIRDGKQSSTQATAGRRRSVPAQISESVNQ